jgi:hypothetical protein
MNLMMWALLAVISILLGCQQQVGPELDEAKAKEYVGKTVLVGITDLDRNGKPTKQRQFFGTISEISVKNGMIVTSKNNATHLALPPDLSTLLPAKPGVYRLRSTGEVVTDPDFLTTWEFKEGDPNKATGVWHRALE